MCLAQGHNVVTPVRLEPGPLGLESNALPLSDWAPDKTGVKQPLSEISKIGFQDQLSLNYCITLDLH